MGTQIRRAGVFAILVFFSMMLRGGASEAATLISCKLLATSKPAPERATFVLKKRDVSMFGQKGWKALSKASPLRSSGASHSFRTSDGTKRFATLEAFDTDSYKLTVFAKDGDQYEVPVRRRCGSGVFVVQKGWKSPRSPLPQFAIGDREQLVIANLKEAPSYVSVKWAFLAGDLEGGHFERSESWRWTRPLGGETRPGVGPNTAAGELVYLQFFQQNLDGTTLDWKGWAATTAAGALTVGKGLPPKALAKTYSAAARCPSPSIHKVPSRPNFKGAAPEVVEDASGTPLKTASSNLGFVVEATVGQSFRVEDAPRSVCPTWYEVEEGLQRAFSFPSQIALSRFGDDRTYAFELWFSTLQRRWPPLQLRWSTTRNGLSAAKAAISQRPGFSNYWPTYFVIPDAANEFYVEVVPQWSDPKARVGVTARVRLDRKAKTWSAKFDQVTPLP